MDKPTPRRSRRNKDKEAYRWLFVITALLSVIFIAILAFGGVDKMTIERIAGGVLLLVATVIFGIMLHRTKEEIVHPEAEAELRQLDKIED